MIPDASIPGHIEFIGCFFKQGDGVNKCIFFGVETIKRHISTHKNEIGFGIECIHRFDAGCIADVSLALSTYVHVGEMCNVKSRVLVR